MTNHPQEQPGLSFLQVRDRALLEKTYRLRHQVYCLERGFLPADCYPASIETDEFDHHAMHFAAMETGGHVVGTVRVVLHSPAGLPLDRFFRQDGDLYYRGVPRRKLGEISRLAVRAPVRDDGGRETVGQLHRRPEIAVGLYKEIYQASRNAGISHLIAAMERPLARLLHRFAFPFHPVGPEIDYYGPVRPYLIDIAEGERALFERCPRTFARFAAGLPRHLQPRWFGADRPAETFAKAVFD